MIPANQLCDELGITAEDLESFVELGLPCDADREGRQLFDADTVLEWLRANNLVDQDQQQHEGPICSTADEAAIALGVNRRTLQDWAKMPGFPGRQGNPGRRNGYYPIEAIKTWRDEQTRDRSGRDSVYSELAAIKLQREQLDLDERIGRLVDADQVAAFFERVAATAKAILAPLPERMIANFPTSVSIDLAEADSAAVAAELQGQRVQALRVAEETIRDALDTIAELIAGDEDDKAEDKADETPEGGGE